MRGGVSVGADLGLYRALVSNLQTHTTGRDIGTLSNYSFIIGVDKFLIKEIEKKCGNCVCGQIIRNIIKQAKGCSEAAPAPCLDLEMSTNAYWTS